MGQHNDHESQFQSSAASKEQWEQMKAHRIPLHWRDNCAMLLIPLNACRRKNKYLPWECQHEKHEYEQCQFVDYARRIMEADKLKKDVSTEP